MPFEAKLSRPRMALMALGCLLFLAGGLWVLGALGEAPTETTTVGNIKRIFAGWAGIILGGAALPIFVQRLFQSGVEVRIDSEGIYWRRWSDRVIPWSAIKAISVAHIQRQHFACLYLHDPSAYPSTGIAGRTKALSRALGSTRYGDISLTVTGTDRKFPDMAAAVERFAPAELQEPGAAEPPR